MNVDEFRFIENVRGKIIRDIEIKHPSFISIGHLKLIVEDPKDGTQYKAQINLG